MTISSARKRFSIAEQLRDIHQVDAPNNLSSLFDEEPVTLDTFVRDPAYLANPDGLYPFQLELVSHTEQVFRLETYIAMVEEFGPQWAPHPMVNLIVVEVGKGGGKDHGCRVASCRVSYMVSCLRDPQGYYGLAPQDDIHTLNVAPTSNLARRAYFKPLGQLVLRSPWFQRHTISEITPQSTSILLRKQLEMVSGHSLIESFEGLNPILSIADEISGFRAEVEKIGSARGDARSAEAVIAVLRSSGRSRFPDVYKTVAISYPRYKGDPIENLMARGRKDIEAKGADSRYWIFGPKGTVEVNPKFAGLSAEEAFPEDFEEDPLKATAMYKCQPSRSPNRFFRDDTAIRRAFPAQPADVLPPVEILPFWAIDAEAQSKMRLAAITYDTQERLVPHSWQVQHVLHGLRPMAGCLYALHADLAVSGDRAGICMAHVRAWRRTPGEDRVESHPVVKVDFLTNYEADPTALTPDEEIVPREIQLRWFRELVMQLAFAGFPIGLVTVDGWQCLTGDMQIPLLDGTSPTMQELAERSAQGEQFWVYSIKDGRVVPGRCTKAWKTAHRDDMLEVELDNGEVVRSTSDHRFMMRDGAYRQAKDLAPGDSLMPLYRRQRPISPGAPEYEQVWHPTTDAAQRHWQFTHGMVSRWKEGVQQPKGVVVHHMDCVKSNNVPENLVRMTNQAHSEWHQANTGGGATFRNAWADPQWREAHIARLRTRKTGRPNPHTGRRPEITWEHVVAAYEAVRAEGGTPGWRRVAERLGCDQSVLYTRLKANGYAGWRAFRWAQEGRTDAALRTARYKERQRTLEPNNHKVTAVRPAKPAGVYDLQVEETHNFALAAGVFVHNSTDTTQILESWGIEAKVQSIDRTPMPYQTLRDVMYDGRLEGYDDGIIVDELEGLTRLPNGKIDHPADGSKDEADSLAGAVMAAIELGGDEGEHPEVIDLDASFDLGMNGFGTMGAQAQDMSVDATSWGEMSWQPQA